MPNSSMERLVYRSRAVQPPPMLALDSILAVSQSWNTRTGVTGVLGVTGRTYIQFLEGPAEELDSLMERLHRDPRHTDVTVLTRGPVAVRLVPGWSMARIDLSLLATEVTALLQARDGDGLAALLADVARQGETEAR